MNSNRLTPDALPAVVIGGPPHSGKSVFTFSLTQALRNKKVPHYVLRAAPDGEGDFSSQADQELVRAIRIKGAWTDFWLEKMREDINRRHLPLLVDPGGKPTPEQEALFADCTHAILLCPDAASQGVWRDRFERLGVIIIAELLSDLHGTNRLIQNDGQVRGVLAGLERGQFAQGEAFDAVVEYLTRLFGFSYDELWAMHEATAPVELAVELNWLAQRLQIWGDPPFWKPEHLPQLLEYLPPHKPLAVYGRAPIWLYAALALHAVPEPFYNFDARLGWTVAPTLRVGSNPSGQELEVKLLPRAGYVRAEVILGNKYLAYESASAWEIPTLAKDGGVILSGKLPLWLWNGLVRAYADVPWIGIYQPQLGDRAIVIMSRDFAHTVGQLVDSSARA